MSGEAKPSTLEAARASLMRSAALKPFEYLVWLPLPLLIFLFPSKAFLLNEIAILALFAVSLDLILGFAGIVSLGHAAFFGAGAYTAGILAANGFGAPLLGLAAGGAAAALLGFATSFFILRGSDLTRLMITLGLQLILLELANRFSGLTGGTDGLYGMTVDPIAGLFSFDLTGQTAWFYSLTVLFAAFLFARRLVHSPFGRSLKAVKGNRRRAAFLGIDTNRRLVAIYTVSAGLAGLAGVLLAQTTQFVSLDVLDFHRSAEVLLVLVIGGTGYLYGGIFGAVIFKLMQDWLSGMTPQYWQFWIGLLLVAIVLVGRERMTGGLGRLAAFLPGRPARRAAKAPAAGGEDAP
ncbi:branched-chain amino acid ABC transporter permease [Afifella sp. IM 167]|uniref:branched-chain amino acid ABC transporter permease n=1 Tax=Afifella sp. IM 167 TaxID=2033586 RepID=UPI001CCF83FF|nr:branched-chain amino acid ABC transporter permease [Afifella sp. IM 167]MBZ8132120.1 branched-chain amino acid ABC transporter permease [Afifella sp. IM 167]